ncbi:MAG: hypothetical protein KGH61_01435 [Candidatus Micrarchaeota archaeon]|nr:hypothetical protein [Candidatus Micrarchaeota archaeon]MDE1847593.1 hypothetical protein [Candidatus Micrarchaeota archaeon]MDE1864825.1 hypothetical protein [Candidatus Micrarchaeota archaeon]
MKQNCIVILALIFGIVATVLILHNNIASPTTINIILVSEGIIISLIPAAISGIVNLKSGIIPKAAAKEVFKEMLAVEVTLILSFISTLIFVILSTPECQGISIIKGICYMVYLFTLGIGLSLLFAALAVLCLALVKLNHKIR